MISLKIGHGDLDITELYCISFYTGLIFDNSADKSSLGLTVTF